MQLPRPNQSVVCDTDNHRASLCPRTPGETGRDSLVGFHRWLVGFPGPAGWFHTIIAVAPVILIIEARSEAIEAFRPPPEPLRLSPKPPKPRAASLVKQGPMPDGLDLFVRSIALDGAETTVMYPLLSHRTVRQP